MATGLFVAVVALNRFGMQDPEVFVYGPYASAALAEADVRVEVVAMTHKRTAHRSMSVYTLEIINLDTVLGVRK